MPKVRSPYEEPVIVAWLDGRVVKPSEVVTVLPAQLPGFLESGWEPADPETTRTAKALKGAEDK